MYPNKHFQLYFMKFILHMRHILWASFTRIFNIIYTSTSNTSCYLPCVHAHNILNWNFTHFPRSP